MTTYLMILAMYALGMYTGIKIGKNMRNKKIEDHWNKQ